MMKTVLILLGLTAISVVSCVEKHEPDINRGVDVSKLEALAEYEVPVREGYTSVVTFRGETLATTRISIKILVPVEALRTRADGIEVNYTNEEIHAEFGDATYWQYLSFEDTHNGDYDYNDVVIHCRIISRVPHNYKDGNVMCTHVVSVQPVALGGTRDLQLGILYKDDAGEIREQIICNNIRKDLFLGDPTFPINTDAKIPARKVTNYLTDYLTCQTHNTLFPVVWFLQAKGSERLYAASTNFGANERLNMISEDGYPYGISLTKAWRYPVERCHIRNAYPGFDKWLKDGMESTLFNETVLANTFPATIRLNPQDGNLWDWQERPAVQ